MKSAVIQTGGKQYVVAEGDVVTIEKLPDVAVGSKVSFDQVFLKTDGDAVTVGTPLVSGGLVSGEVTALGRAAKVIVMRYKQKSRYLKKNGHRQPFVKVKITAIA